MGKPRNKNLHQYLHNRRRKRQLFIVIAVLTAIIAGWHLFSWLSFVVAPAREDYTFGTSFSIRQSESFGLDWRQNYTALLDDLEIRSYRLMSYWDDIEPKRGEFNFTNLDWQMDEAAKRNAKVSLAIGLRQPRWPECHEPKWSLELDKDNWKQALYAYTKVVVKRYENHPALENFQLENEAFAWWFGDCRENPDRQRIVEEYELIKSWTSKPIWMSLSDQYGLPMQHPIADGLGYSLYTKVYNNLLPGTYVEPSPPLWFHQLRADTLRAMYGRDMFLHELQLEPWGDKAIKQLTIKEQDQTMDVERIKYNLLFARKIGFDHIYTWGSEWWYWRLMNGDDSVWNTVRAEVQASKS